MDGNRTNGGDLRTPGRPRAGRPWWQRSWGAALMLVGAAVLMGAVLTVWGEAALLGN